MNIINNKYKKNSVSIFIQSIKMYFVINEKKKWVRERERERKIDDNYNIIYNIFIDEFVRTKNT